MPFDPNDPDTKAALKAAVDEAKRDMETSISRLETKNRDLIAELREAKKGKEIDPAEHAKLQDQVQELKEQLDKAAKDGKAALDKVTAELTNTKKALEGETGAVQKLLVDAGLSEALVKANVEPQFMPAVKALLSGKVKVVADGESRKAVVDDKPLAEFVTGWAGSDEGKHYVKAPVNGGGGAGGGTGGAGAGEKNAPTVNINDSAAFGTNLEAIAKGKANLVFDQPAS